MVELIKERIDNLEEKNRRLEEKIEKLEEKVSELRELCQSRSLTKDDKKSVLQQFFEEE